MHLWIEIREQRLVPNWDTIAILQIKEVEGLNSVLAAEMERNLGPC